MINARAFILSLAKPKFHHTYDSRFNARSILDIGIANKSYQETKLLFPGSRYSGIDILPIDFTMGAGDDFHLANLDEVSDLNFLGGQLFDVIFANHVLEHLARGERIYELLCHRLAPGGVFYAEYPSIRTARQKKTRYSYHFHDDPTHRRLYAPETLANIALNQGLKIVSCGYASAPLKTLGAIPRAALMFFSGKPYGSSLLFMQKKIDYILVQKPAPDPVLAIPANRS